jgi:hypothetical protein
MHSENQQSGSAQKRGHGTAVADCGTSDLERLRRRSRSSAVASTSQGLDGSGSGLFRGLRDAGGTVPVVAMGFAGGSRGGVSVGS